MTCRRKCTKRGDRTTLVTVFGPSLTKTANDDGQIVESNNNRNLGQRWMKVLPVSGRERRISDQVQADVTHVANVPYDDLTKTITPRMWLVKPDGTRLNVIRAVDPDQRQREMELELEERVASWTP